jgi:YbgC/YbaW family acyl-CoA thioester hydrolase
MIKEPASIYTIRFQDCDPMGHLNNSRYIDYIINAREDHMDHYYNRKLSDFIASGYCWVVTNHEIYYIKPSIYNEKVKIQTSLIEADETSILVEGIMMSEDERQFKSLLWTRYFYVNVKTGKREQHSPEQMEFFNTLKNDHLSQYKESKSRLKTLLDLQKSRVTK